MDGKKVPPRSAATELAGLLDSPEIGRLIAELDETRWTGRPGYPLRAMVGMALAKSLYAIPTWTRTVRLVREHAALRLALGGEVPSVYACYRFAAKLRGYQGLLDACIARVLFSLKTAIPDLGCDLTIDASDLPAYANGQRFVSKDGPERERYSDPDASWGHRSAVSTRNGGGFYGYRVHAAVCARTDLPVAWQVETAGSHESNYVAPLLDEASSRGFAADTTALDMGYNNERVYGECEDRDSRPIIPLRETPAVKAGKASPPTCEHGEWRFAGADTVHARTKWRCPTGECLP
ncbi:MAG TPA: transposase [Thermoleophilaceae bacterium]|nr:transposase [Thermoleophilaceae bacterium]